VRKLHVWALVMAFVFITTWIVAAHIAPGAAHALQAVAPSVIP
jgi:uncharacterized membrane protein YhdT